MAWQDSAYAERETTVDLDRGLFVLRYAAGPASGVAPSALARPAFGCEASIDLLSPPGASAGAMEGPGDCVVVRAERPARLTLLIRAARGGSLDASFQFEPLSRPVAAEARTSAPQIWSAVPQRDQGLFAPPAPLGGLTNNGLGNNGLGNGFSASGFAGAAPAEPVGIELLAHVARRGDVVAERGGWAAGPAAPAAIEGVALSGALPAGVQIDMQALVATTPPRWLDWTPFGGFAGTRGRALPLSGLRLRLSGPSAAYELHVEALFLGSSIIARRGRDIELIAASGADPLVGLKIDLVSGTGLPVLESSVARAPAPPVVEGAPRESKIRVFRAASGA